jgi:hypothetical protein
MRQSATLRAVPAGLIAFGLLAACSTVAPTIIPVSSPPSSSGVPPITQSASAEPTVSPEEQPTPTETAASPQPTSEELIANALAAGQIDIATSLTYRAYALYGDARLPEAYRSEVIDYEAGARLVADVHEQTPNLSPAILAEIGPILARPNDPISVFNQLSPAASRAMLASTWSAAARTATVSWVSAPAADGAARVWIKDFPGAQEAMKIFASEVVSPIWPKLLQFFRTPLPDDGKPGNATNPDPAIDIYLVDFKDVDPRLASCATDPSGQGCRLPHAYGGWTPMTAPIFGNKSSAYMLVRADDSPAGERQTIAHELFHAAQDAFDYDEAPTWLGEATATWGEFRITRALGDDPTGAHEFLPAIFDELEQPLTTFGDIHQYGAYLYFYFAQMECGCDDIVLKTWQLAAAPGKQGAQAIGQLLPFRDAFPEFALRSWNKPPVHPLYNGPTDPTFPDLQPPALGGLHEMTAASPPVGLPSLLDPLSAVYFHFTFNDANIQQVVFDNSLVGQPDAAVQALVYLQGTGWQPARDWSAQKRVSFCRDQPNKDILELVLIVSNSSVNKVLSAAKDPQLEAKPDPCANWAGTVTKSYTKRVVGPGFSDLEDGSISANVTWAFDPSAAHDANDAAVFKPVDGQLAWQFKATYAVTGLTCTASGSGSFPLNTLDYSDLNYFGRDGYLVTWTDPSGQHLYEVNGAIISNYEAFPLKFSCLTAPFPPSWSPDWLTTTQDPEQEAPFGGLPIGQDGHISGTYTTDTCSGSQELGSKETCTWTWDFEPAP